MLGDIADSSFYDIIKINENEFWAGGEFGILKKIDSLGNVSSTGFFNEGISILKLLKTEKYIFIATAEGVIYRYDLATNQFLKKEFVEFKQKCFYDIIELKNGKLLVSGGTTSISKDKNRIPQGFIAEIDMDLTNIKLVYKCYRKFVWSVLETQEGPILAVAFNGINTTVIKSVNLAKWDKMFKIKGLVHKIIKIEDKIWYCGARSIWYRKNGTLGNEMMAKAKVRLINKDGGCLWYLNKNGDNILAVSYAGEILKLNSNAELIEKIKVVPTSFTLYDFERISDTKIITVGHGRGAFLVDFKQ